MATSIICTSTGTSEGFMWFEDKEMTMQLQKLHRSSCRIGRSWGRGNFIAIKGRMFAEREDMNNNTTYFLHCNFCVVFSLLLSTLLQTTQQHNNLLCTFYFVTFYFVTISSSKEVFILFRHSNQYYNCLIFFFKLSTLNYCFVAVDIGPP